MPFPNFIIFGAVKSGTGALYQYLKHHPEIYVSSIKEPRYFTKNKDNLSKDDQKTKLNEYLKCFDGVTKEKAIGEASSNYINTQVAAIRIKNLIPDVRLIASLRNPVDRAIAHYRMMNKNVKKIDAEKIRKGKGEGWATTSLYFNRLNCYFEIFKEEQIKVFILEQWQKNVENTLKEIYIFLNVDENYQVPYYINYTAAEVAWPGIGQDSMIRKIKKILPTKLLIKINSAKKMLTPKSQQLPVELRQEMMGWYRDDIEKLQDFLKKDLSIWLR